MKCLLVASLCTCCTVITLVFTGALVGGIVAGVGVNQEEAADTRARGGPEGDIPVTYSPGDTRIVPFSPFFCNELTLEDRSNRTGATLYLITDTPPLTDKNSFTIDLGTPIFLSDNVFFYLTYYLYPNSSLTTFFRVGAYSDRCSFYLIKGRSNFSQWINNPSTDLAVQSATTECSGLPSSALVSFYIRAEDDYYFVYHNYHGRAACHFTNSGSVLIDVSISVSRILYNTSGLTTAPRCSAIAGEHCSLNVPAADSNYRALIVTDLPNSPDSVWEENIDISLHCSSNRAWAYVVVVLVPSLIIIGVCITIVILLGCVCWRKRDSLRACCSQSHRTTQSTTTEEAPPTSTVQFELQETQSDCTKPQVDQRNKTTPATDDTLNDGHLTAVPPPSYKASMDYPTQKLDLPPPYSK